MPRRRISGRALHRDQLPVDGFADQPEPIVAKRVPRDVATSVWLLGARLLGTVLAQALFVPAALAIAAVARVI